MKAYYGEYNTLERGEGAVMKESQKVGGRGVRNGWGWRDEWAVRCRAARCSVDDSHGSAVGNFWSAPACRLLMCAAAKGRRGSGLPGWHLRLRPPAAPAPTLVSQQVADLVDKFYSLVTDLYEWGWGQSFHFSRKLPKRDWVASEVAHEAWAAATIRLG